MERLGRWAGPVQVGVLERDGVGRWVRVTEGEAMERVKLAAHFLAPGSCEVGGDRPATCFVQNFYVEVSALTFFFPLHQLT